MKKCLPFFTFLVLAFSQTTIALAKGTITIDISDITLANTDDIDDGISCGSSDWKPFQTALVSHCEQISKKNPKKKKLCQKVLIPAFKDCKFEGNSLPDSLIAISRISKKEIANLQIFRHEIYGGGVIWQTIFFKKANQWHVIDIDTGSFE